MKRMISRIKDVGATLGFSLLMFGASGMDSESILIPAIISIVGVLMLLVATKL